VSVFYFFFSKNLKNCHVSVYHRATWQLTSMTRGSLGNFPKKFGYQMCIYT